MTVTRSDARKPLLILRSVKWRSKVKHIQRDFVFEGVEKSIEEMRPWQRKEQEGGMEDARAPLSAFC